MSDEKYTSYHVAAAYVDGAGARVLEAALRRGADVTLVMPRNPNVYHDANRKALCKLVNKYGAENGAGTAVNVRGIRSKNGATTGREGTITAYLCDEMLHAKVREVSTCVRVCVRGKRGGEGNTFLSFPFFSFCT